MKIKRVSSLLIPNSLNSCEDIKSFLTRSFKNYHDGKITSFCFFHDTPQYLVVPRYFPIMSYGDFEIEDISCQGKDININSKIQLRNEIQQTTVNYMIRNNNGIIQLSPGSGKTVISIHVVCLRKKKTLVLTHRQSLVDQWKERFLQFTDLTEKDIEIFKTSNIEKSLSKPVTIATVQSLLSSLTRKEYETKRALWMSKIGITISDEVHTTTGAMRFSEVSLYIPSRVNFGLSATPERKDGTGDIMKYHLGEIYKPIGSSGTMDAKIIIMLCDLEIQKNKYIYWGGKFQRTRYLNQLSKSDFLIDLSLYLLNKFGSDRNVLFVGERIKLIETLFNRTECSDKSKFIQNATNRELDSKVTFATIGKIRDGVDAPQKDFLLIPSPVSNIEQLVGRVVRSFPNKKDPVVIDIVDINFEQIRKTLNSRLKYYESKDWKIKFLFIDKNRVSKNITREKALEIVNGSM